jgi:hypothetical protein
LAGGENVNIGVISDGVDDLIAVQNSLAQELGDVTVLSSGSWNEGIAMLEIIHDLAPNANLFFHDEGGSYADFAVAVNELRNRQCDIIVDDFDPNADPDWDWRNGDDPYQPYPSSVYTMYNENLDGSISAVSRSAPWNQWNAWDGLDDNNAADGWRLFNTPFKMASLAGSYVYPGTMN